METFYNGQKRSKCMGGCFNLEPMKKVFYQANPENL